MNSILIIHKDKIFLEFLKNFLAKKGYKIETAVNGGIALNKLITFKPELIISSKEIPNLNLDGFFLKKRMIKETTDTPTFLIGDFSADELINYKKQGVKAFISTPVNPFALLERVNQNFKKETPLTSERTPMLSDVFVKGNIIIVQIEANFEEDKLELMNYKIRSYCHYKKIKRPKFLFVFPSLYPESITIENLETLFSFLKFPELEISFKDIKILTRNNKLLELLKQHEIYSKFDIVQDFLTGINSLIIDTSKMKKIPVNFLKPGIACILDLYDDEGEIRIPAYSKISEEMINYLQKSGVKQLTYFSDKSFDEIANSGNLTPPAYSSFERIHEILMEYDTIEKYSEFSVIADDKMSLFFRKLKGLSCFILVEDKNDVEVIKNSFESYLNVYLINYNENLIEEIENKKCILLFLEDKQNSSFSSLEVLYKIRSKISRRRITIIIISKKIDKISLSQYKKYGTDYIIISPFTTSKLLQKAFYYINTDRMS